MADTDKQPNLHQRMNAVMNEVTYVRKEKKSGMRYSIVSHDDVTAKLRPSMVKHGIIAYPSAMDMQQQGNRTQSQMFVRFANIDDPQDYIEVASGGYGIDEQDKGPGKAISYAFKYACLKAFMLETGDDPDNDQDVQYSEESDPHLALVQKVEAKLAKDYTKGNAQALAKEFGEALKKAEKHHATAVAKLRKEITQLIKGDEA